MRNCTIPLTLGKSYDIRTTKGWIEAQVVQENVAIYASDYGPERWHERFPLTGLQIGGILDRGEILSIRERE